MQENFYKTLFHLWKYSEYDLEDKIFSSEKLIRQMIDNIYSMRDMDFEDYLKYSFIRDNNIIQIEKQDLNSFKESFNYMKDVQQFIKNDFDLHKCKYCWVFQKQPYYLYNNNIKIYSYDTSPHLLT
jgi:hypothetical protein